MSNTGRAAPNQPGVSKGIAWATVLLLCMLYMFAYLDRLIFSLLIGGIKAEFGTSDTKLGLLVGASFAIFYVLFALPMSRLADRWNRRRLIVIAALIWNGMTAASAFAPNFETLVVMRIGVALGEAALVPAAMSMLGDLFEREARTKPIAVFVGAGSIGASGSMVFGAAIVQLATLPVIAAIPVIGELAPWRLTLFLLGTPGLFFVLLFWLLSREPVRIAHEDVTHPSVPDVARHMGSNFTAYAAVIMTPCLIGVAGTAMLTWYPTFLERHFAMEIAQAGYAFGLIGLLATPLAVAAGPAWMNFVNRRGRDDGYIWVIIAASLAVVPLMIASMSAASSTLSLVFAAPAYFLIMTASNLSIVTMPLLAPARMRGQAMAVFMFAGVLVSLGVGPYIVAFVSEQLYPGDQGLGKAMTAVTYGVVPLLIAGLLLTRKAFATAMHAAAEREKAGSAYAASASIGNEP